MVDERNLWDSFFEWRVAWDMRGNRDYETDAYGNFLYRDEFGSVGGGSPRLWGQQRRRIRHPLRARRAAEILRKLGIDVVARVDVLRFRPDVSIPTYEDHIYVSKPGYGEIRSASELLADYWTDARFE